MEIKIYNKGYQKEWDNCVRESRNGTFLLCRDFMEYHSDRFEDHSLMFFNENKLIAVLPGNISDNTFYSHQGLTYGSLILPKEIKIVQVTEIFDCLILHLREKGITRIIYKTVPHIYHTYPCEEDLYILFRQNATLFYRNLSCCIYMNERIKYPRIRKRAIARAINNNLRVEDSCNFEAFWEILGENLQNRYGSKPVHTVEEISGLKAKFPDEIHLFQSKNEEKVLAGALVFVCKTVVHVQYSSASEEGRQIGALDIIYDFLLEKYADKKYFDFGTSNEDNGLYLNDSLIAQKESFGGRGIAYDAYAIEI